MYYNNKDLIQLCLLLVLHMYIMYIFAIYNIHIYVKLHKYHFKWSKIFRKVLRTLRPLHPSLAHLFEFSSLQRKEQTWRISGILGVTPSQDASDHQDDDIFRRDSDKFSFATVAGRRPLPKWNPLRIIEFLVVWRGNQYLKTHLHGIELSKEFFPER